VVSASTMKLIALSLLLTSSVAQAQSLDLPSHRWGLSFGNSKDFTGLRFNFRDDGVQAVRGFNFTLWRPEDNDATSRITGLSFGPIAGGGTLRGLQLGILGVEAQHGLAGVSMAVLGVGGGANANGIQIAGIGMGAGGSVRGINLAGIGVGAGQDLIGLSVAGIGAGAGGDVWGLTVAGIGAGAGGNVRGITIAGLGAGAGGNMMGLNVAGLGVGAGGRLSGINVAGLAMGAGDRVQGINVAGLAVGGPDVRGLSIAGGAVGGQHLEGVQLAGGAVLVTNDGTMKGFSASAVNWIKGTQVGVTVGIVNYAYRVRGLQLGAVNIVRDNPAYARVLPILNGGF
jgi:hypothetical protein